MRSKLMLALTLSAALAAPLALEGNALAASLRAVLPTPDLGMAIMSANVDEDGRLTGGAGAMGALRKANGLYFVAFTRSVYGCTYVGAVSGPFGVVYRGFVSTEGGSDTFNGATYYGVNVATAGPNALAADTPFHVIVFCAR